MHWLTISLAYSFLLLMNEVHGKLSSYTNGVPSKLLHADVSNHKNSFFDGF